MKDLNCKPSAREIFIWNILGSMANAVLSVITLMLATRLLNDDETDIFSIAWSISQMMATIATFQIRTYQATDVKEEFKFKQYLIFRRACIGIMLVSSCGYVYINHFDLYKSIIVLLVCIFRAVDALADVYEGYFQQKERLDLVGKAVTYRVIAAIGGFALSLIIFQNLLLSTLVLFLSYLLCFFGFNIRYSKEVKCFKVKEKWNEKSIVWIWKLVKEGAPIFINAFLMTSITNAPRMKIDAAIANGEMMSGGQTIFNIIFMPASVLTLVYIVFRPLLTKMAIEWTQGHKKGFMKIVGTIFGCLLGIAIVLLVGSAILGIPFLSILYATDLKAYKLELLVIILGGCFCTFSYLLDNALIVIRKQYLLICSYIIAWGYVECFVSVFVKKWQLLGAALAYTTSMIAFFVVTFAIFIICIKKSGETDGKSEK